MILGKPLDHLYNFVCIRKKKGLYFIVFCIDPVSEARRGAVLIIQKRKETKILNENDEKTKQTTTQTQWPIPW